MCLKPTVANHYGSVSLNITQLYERDAPLLIVMPDSTVTISLYNLDIEPHP